MLTKMIVGACESLAFFIRYLDVDRIILYVNFYFLVFKLSNNYSSEKLINNFKILLISNLDRLIMSLIESEIFDDLIKINF